jgi:hypothetical protein
LPICSGTNPGTLSATASGGTGSYAYLWYKDGISTGITTQAYDPGSLTVSSEFFCALTSGSCGTVNTLSINITVNPLPVASITSVLTTTCTDSYQATLTASIANSYLWNTSATTQSITVSSKGNYSVIVTDINGCSSTSETVIVLR